MKQIALVLPEIFEGGILLRVLERLARRQPLRVRLCSQEQQLSACQSHLLGQLQAINAATSPHLCVTMDCLQAIKPDLVLVACTTPDAARPVSRKLVQDLSRRSPLPVWIMNAQTGPPCRVTALIDPYKESRFDPCLAADVLRLSFKLARALDIPMDIMNVWYFRDEGLLRSWRIRMPEQEVAARRRRAAWIAQADLGRVLSTLPPELTWHELHCLQGPVIDGLEGALPADTLVVTGSEGRDGWAARLQPNLAECLCRRTTAQIVIVKKPHAPTKASLDEATLHGPSNDKTLGPNSEDQLRKKRFGSP
ncbi:hypothetical protein [Paracoccus benzoatiresistens]|uniref:Universal stress protein n=1 Tax=Paracoccus benzoatiresistens TaxID=2997341 RepID=A0ABT4J8K5_9RHOB|nr:hypothetical protein [Paracoccus sp. EF6]MCZ0963421.1 hypothetical protein [Paracoccus sp. EF6]